jgi:Myb-like DNA-binding domain
VTEPHLFANPFGGAREALDIHCHSPCQVHKLHLSAEIRVSLDFFFFFLGGICLFPGPDRPANARERGPRSDAHMILVQTPTIISRGKVDISLLLKSEDEEETAPRSAEPPAIPSSSYMPVTAMGTITARASMPIASTPLTSAPPPVPLQVKRLQPAHVAEPPAKKSKWSPEEDALIIELRGRGMKWEDISKRLPGRSAISCRLHYQNYLERRSEWDEDRKNKLARLYER